MLINIRTVFSICVVIIFSSISNVFSAQISENNAQLTTVRGCSVTLEGLIVQGDAKKIETAIRRVLDQARLDKIRRNPPDAEYYETFIVCLSGPGGDYLEGIKLAEVFSEFNVATVVPDYASCESACAIAFLGGSGCCNKSGKSISQRYIFPGSKLGFHAPLLDLESGKFPRQIAEKAYELGLQAVSQLRQKSELLNINKAFLSNIFTHHGQDFYKISTLEIAELNDIFLTGYKKRELRLDTTVAACWNSYNWELGLDGLRELKQKYGLPSTTGVEHWNGRFKNTNTPTNQLFIKGQKGVFHEWYGFNEDSTICQVRFVKKDKRTLVEVFHGFDVSQNGDPNRWRLLLRPTVFMRGNRSLESTR